MEQNTAPTFRRERKYPRKSRDEKECPKCKKSAVPVDSKCPNCSYRYIQKRELKAASGAYVIFLYASSLLLPPLGAALASFRLLEDNSDPVAKKAFKLCGISLIIMFIFWAMRSL